MNLDPPKTRDGILAVAFGLATLLVSGFVVFVCLCALGDRLDALPPFLASVVFYSLLFIPPIVGGSATRWFLRRSRSEIRFEFPRCDSCGYNLTRNVSGICPECGKPTNATTEAQPKGRPL